MSRWNIVQKLMAELDFPGTVEAVSYGTPSFKVRTKFLCRILDDAETLVIHSDDRDVWLADAPDVFFFTEHYRNYPYVLVRLGKISRPKLRQLLTQCWKEIAPPKSLREWGSK